MAACSTSAKPAICASAFAVINTPGLPEKRGGWRAGCAITGNFATMASPQACGKTNFCGYKPVFNVMNTRGNIIRSSACDASGGGSNCASRRDARAPRRTIFGAFKGLPLVRGAFAALMRLLWIADHRITSPFEIPSALWTENLSNGDP